MIANSKNYVQNIIKEISLTDTIPGKPIIVNNLIKDTTTQIHKIKYIFHSFLKNFQDSLLKKDIIYLKTSPKTRLFTLCLSPLRLLQYFTYVDFYSVQYKERSVYLFKLDKKIYVLSKSFILFDIIDIKEFQRVIQEGQRTIKLKFYDKNMNDIQIKLFSKKDLFLIVKNMLPFDSPPKQYQYLQHAITTMLNSTDSLRVLNYMVNKSKQIISSSRVFYQPEVYDLLHFNIKDNIKNKNMSNKCGRKLFFSIFFIFNNLKTINNVYNNIYPFRNKLYFSRKKIMNMSEKNPLRVLFFEHEQRFERPTSSVADFLDSLEESINKKDFKIIEIKKHAPILKSSRISNIIYDPQYIEIFNYLSLNSEKIESISKSRNNSVKFDKVVFNITIPKSFGNKEHKTLELNNNGSFIICERDRVTI
jgi:hypothetical protein